MIVFIEISNRNSARPHAGRKESWSEQASGAISQKPSDCVAIAVGGDHIQYTIFPFKLQTEKY